MQIASKPRTIYLRNRHDRSITKWELRGETDIDWTVEANTQTGTARFTRLGYQEATEEEYWQERWATLERGKVLERLWENGRITFERLKQLAEWVGYDWEEGVRRVRR